MSITKTEIRKGTLGFKKGWCFDIYFNNRPFPNLISALFRTKKEATSELQRYIDTGKYAFYGSAE